MNAEIIDRGRGPEIKGTRITVYDVMDYYTMGWNHSSIALWFGLSSRQVLAAIKYIEEHKAEVEADYEKILERCRRGNPPELQAKLDAVHAKYQALWAERKKRYAQPSDKEAENGDAGTAGGH
jgi:uncharacterized protein (DUF433 family)